MLQNLYVTCDMTVAAASVLAKVSKLRKGRLELDYLQLSCCCSGDCQGGLASPRGTLLLACQADKGSSAGVGGSQLASIELYVIC